VAADLVPAAAVRQTGIGIVEIAASIGIATEIEVTSVPAVGIGLALKCPRSNWRS
jgi:hypothetical protein